jgi:hypothetical protein
MILRRLTANLKAQNWTAIAIEFVIASCFHHHAHCSSLRRTRQERQRRFARTAS